MPANAFVMDSSALLAFLYGERGRDRVEDLLVKAADGRCSVRLHRIHVCEVYYVLFRKGGENAAETMLRDIRSLPTRIEDRVSPALLRETGRIKASYRLSFADAFAAGLAKVRDAALVSCDHREFEPLETAGEIRVLWTR